MLSTLRILLLLLGGAILNLFIAIACALWSDFPTTSQEVLMTSGQWPRAVGQRWPSNQVLVSREEAFGLTFIKAWAVKQNRKDTSHVLTRYLKIAHARNIYSDSRLSDLIDRANTLHLASLSTDDGQRPEHVEQVKKLLRDSLTFFNDEDVKQFNLHYLSLLDQSTNYSLFVREAGWPWRCLDAEARSNKSLQPHGRNAIQLPRQKAGMRLASGRWIPLNPLWTTFGLNTIFYALLLWPFSLAPQFIRHSIRYRSGQCPICSTPIGIDSHCLECGHDLSSFWQG